MGLLVSKISQALESLGSVFSNRQARIVMIGLDAAGKTTILYKLKLDEAVQTLPTIGFNVETIQHNRLTMTVWDIGGQHKIRPLWRHYYHGTDAVIFVVDSADRERLFEAQDELQKVMSSDELARACILVFANKQDVSGSVSANEMAEQLGLFKSTHRQRLWHVQPCCAKTGQGLVEGLQELARMLKSQPASVDY
ncbi:ADP-ribosylation factor 1 [Capsaspora owczarzaki ATCC 30864]|uniref:ADP-ribosylation factor 1 n=1 Tax=Capsaspora owczarzaki (strain ATCC 30864) TaxID=595528 RepID=A0A0D2UNL0_CAPO3|nr:ADP-ribosylation factor 1 [Capsaspora owczarzaki ATCC 30864]KJE96566.1 ADP-ribosylation factor 1 [Capsaspora owczarzaki ATCC 30864]|eukprot:XP_004344489.1 ADP-ribosylation factor 1 [Capsaspora owczarzaki ATCC 30864]